MQTGTARVEGVASNRRILGPDGKVQGWRGSSCKDAKLRDEPVGLIDQGLRTVVFWNEEDQAGCPALLCLPSDELLWRWRGELRFRGHRP
jgi:hypothetical protein